MKFILDSSIKELMLRVVQLDLSYLHRASVETLKQDLAQTGSILWVVSPAYLTMTILLAFRALALR